MGFARDPLILYTRQSAAICRPTRTDQRHPLYQLHAAPTSIPLTYFITGRFSIGQETRSELATLILAVSDGSRWIEKR